MWIVPVKGTAKALGGNADVGADGGVKGMLVIDAASFNTKNKKRGEHLRSEDFFEVARFPTMEFSAKEVRPAASGRVAIAGALTVRGRSQPLAMEAERTVSGNSAVATTEVEIDRSLWGISWAKMGPKFKNHVAIRAHFDRV